MLAGLSSGSDIPVFGTRTGNEVGCPDNTVVALSLVPAGEKSIVGVSVISFGTVEFCDEFGSNRERKGTTRANTPNRSVVWRTDMAREPLLIPKLYQIEVISTTSPSFTR